MFDVFEINPTLELHSLDCRSATNNLAPGMGNHRQNFFLSYPKTTLGARIQSQPLPTEASRRPGFFQKAAGKLSPGKPHVVNCAFTPQSLPSPKFQQFP